MLGKNLLINNLMLVNTDIQMLVEYVGKNFTNVHKNFGLHQHTDNSSPAYFFHQHDVDNINAAD